ncbi:MAG: lysylphosphatidylglycerol synthase domain-containing protein [Candidatus Delongbacteria bacterium]|nr:lysylphosphatidylglycerol synthase domain-containing protein [Candidatus Delongbacteria bacterium]MDD4204782.1 lysylphosphatidylglycerol synthase domain-containing protein [Candidatus Delongbacteria bacterium]
MLFFLVVWFVIKNISANFDKIRDIEYNSYDPKYIFLSVITVFVSLIYPVFVWRYLLSSLGERINTLTAMRIWFVSNMGRYIPGKVLQIAGLVYLSAAEGIPKNKAVQSVFYSQLTANVLGILMGSALLFFKSGSNDYLNGYQITAVLLTVFLILLKMPAFFSGSVNFFLRKMGKQTIGKELPAKNYLIYILLQTANWFLMSFAFVLLANSYTSVKLWNDPQILFILPISWTLGLLAFFAPGGIGVRESVMTYWLADIMPVEFALVLPWVYRIIVTFSEVVLTVIFISAYKKPEEIKDNTEQN